MNISETQELLTELAASIRAAHEVGTRGRSPHDYAYLKLTSPPSPNNYAIVSTPGVNWFELEIAGGFHTGRADDLATDEDVREYLEDYIRAAVAYLGGHWSAGKSRVFRIPYIVVDIEGVHIKLVRRVRPKLHHTAIP